MLKFAFGIGGNAGVGKSTLARSLAELSTEVIVIAHYGDAMKVELQEIYRANGIEIDTFQKPTPDWLRHLLVGHGNFRRSQNSYYWVEKLDEFVNSIDTTYPDFALIVPDIRYKNECQYVQKQIKGKVLFIEDGDERDVIRMDETEWVRCNADMFKTVYPSKNHFVDPAAFAEELTKKL